MLFSSKFRNSSLVHRLLKNHQLRTATSSATAEEVGSRAEGLKLRVFTEPDDRRGYKYDGTLDLTALIDKGGAMGYINTADADGFRARNFRTGAEPPDPEKAKEIMVFFKNRAKQKPVEKKELSTKSRMILHAARDTTLGRPCEFQAESPQRLRIPPTAQHPLRQSSVLRNMQNSQTNNYSGTQSSGPPPATPRGNYKLSKILKK
uniref:E3 ubiquitin-protein ligase RNF6 n=1 Tax=Lygus hesperus TaxID=30085 RepID=A0A0A9W7Q0_LYGHE